MHHRDRHSRPGDDMRRGERFWRPIVVIGGLGLLGLGMGRQVMARRSELSGYPPSSQYETSPVEGWAVLVNKDFLRRQPGLSQRTLVRLRHQLDQIVRRVPAKAVKQLRTIRIWVEEKEPNTRCMT